MRKWLACAGMAVLLTGCNLTKNPDTIEEQPADPQKTFDDLTEKNREAWAETIVDQMPDVESFTKSATEFNLKGNADVEQVGGNAAVEINIDGEVDRSDPNNPKAKTTINFTGELAGEPNSGNVDGSIEMLIVDNNLYGSLRALNVEIPNVPVSQFMGPIKPLIGKWYGDSLNSLSDLPGTQLDIRNVIAGKAFGPGEVKDKITGIIRDTEIFTMVESLPTENGFYRFQVKLNKDELKKAILELADLSGISDTERGRMSTELDQDLLEVELSGILALNAAEPKYHTFEGELTHGQNTEENAALTVSILEDKKMFSLKNQTSGEHASIEINSADGIDSFRVSGGSTEEEEQTLLIGTKSDTEFKLDILNPDTAAKAAQISLSKSGNIWSGKITNSNAPDIVVFIESLSFDTNTFSLKAIVKNQEKEIANIEADYVLSEATTVTVTAPEKYEPFGTLMEQFFPLFMLGAPGNAFPTGDSTGSLPPDSMFMDEDGNAIPPPPAPEEMSQEEIEAMMESMIKEMEASDSGAMNGMELNFDEMTDTDIGVPLTDEDIEAFEEAEATLN